MMWKVVPGASNAPGSRGPSAQIQPKEPKSLSARARVLIVDDEASICKALSMGLSDAGYDVIAALSGETALAIIRNEHVDVMIVDLRIPDIRGDVIFGVAVGHQPHLSRQTLFMTGDITDRAVSKIAACDCPYIPKPFDLGVMLDAIAALTPRLQDAAG